MHGVYCTYIHMVYTCTYGVYTHMCCVHGKGNQATSSLLTSGSLVVLFVSEILPLKDDPKELHFLVGCIMYNHEKNVKL